MIDPRTDIEAAASRIYEIGEELTDLLTCHLSDSQMTYFWSLWSDLKVSSLDAAFEQALVSPATETACPFCHDPKCEGDCGLVEAS